MKNTRLMDRLFSATEEKDQELTEQVANDIEAAKDNGSVDTDELKYVNLGEGKVAITDLGNGEVICPPGRGWCNSRSTGWCSRRAL